MGWSISWLAIKAPTEEALSTLGLKSTGETVETPEAPLVGTALRDGWYLVVAQGCDHALISDDFVQDISKRAEAVASSIEEHVMVSMASHWSGGSQTWSIVHDAQQAMDHFEVNGSPPASFPAVRDRLLAEQEAEGGTESEVDFLFDLPLEMAEQTAGFRHDGGSGSYPESFDELEPVDESSPLAKKPWWKFW